MKTWKNAEVVELSIAETAWGILPSDKERGIIIGTHDCSIHEGFNNENKGGEDNDSSVTPDTLS